MDPVSLGSLAIKYGPSLLKLGTSTLGFMSGANQAKPQQYDVDNIINRYSGYLDPARGKFNQLGSFGAGLMNMDSQFNQNLKNQFSTMAADRLAQNNRMNTSNAARFGGLSGMVNAQNNASGVGFAQAGMDAFNNAYRGNMGMGMNALGTSGQGLLNIGRNIGDSYGSLATGNVDMVNNYNTGIANNKMTLGMNTMLDSGNNFFDMLNLQDFGVTA